MLFILCDSDDKFTGCQNKISSWDTSKYQQNMPNLHPFLLSNKMNSLIAFPIFPHFHCQLPLLLHQQQGFLHTIHQIMIHQQRLNTGVTDEWVQKHLLLWYHPSSICDTGCISIDIHCINQGKWGLQQCQSSWRRVIL